MSLRERDIVRYVENLRHSAGDLFNRQTDKHLTHYLTDNNFGKPAELRRGRVRLALPYFGWYRVCVEGLVGEIPCCKASSGTSPSFFGPVDTSMLPPDCAVWVALNQTRTYGTIVGTIPSITFDGNYCFSDFVFQGSNVGFREDYYASYITKTGDDGGVIDFSSQRPLDNLTTDWGVATLTGGMLHLDPYMVMLRAGESCGVFCFYPEQILRLSGDELQVDSAVHVENYLSDEGESSIYYGEAAYPWEWYGSHNWGDVLHSETSDEKVHGERIKGKIEPKHDDQQPILRYEEYGGYPAQGHIRQMSVPADVSEINRYTRGQTWMVGVFREHIGWDGAYSLETAKGLRLVKQTVIASPKRIRQAGSQQDGADSINNQNYRPSGVGNSPLPRAEPHNLADYTADGTADASQFVTVVSSLDRLAYDTNEKNLLGFYCHKGDFELPEASSNGINQNQEALPFDDLKTLSGFTAVDPQTLKIDHRLQSKFYKLLQMLEFTDDGGVILQGGYGEQIVFARGNIYVDCPGDVLLRPGKSAITLAGDDAVIRARNSLDLAAEQHDIRIMANVNLHALSGASGYGGTLLENRAEGSVQNYPAGGGEVINSSGVVLKASKSIVSAVGSQIYLRTGSSAGGVQPGNIVLDADSGQSEILSLASTHRRFAKSGYVDSFGDNINKITATNTFSRMANSFSGSLLVDGSVNLTGGMLVRSGIAITQGHISSLSGGQVGRVNATADDQLQRISRDQDKSTAGETIAYDKFDADFYGPARIGQASTQKNISFGWRTLDDYGCTQFSMPQAHWQRLAAGSGAVTAWSAMPVAYQEPGTPTYAWPGVKWTQQVMMTMRQDGHAFYDVEAGRPKPRSYPSKDDFDSVAFEGISAEIPAQHYTVIDR